jgi:hypothetical protein
LGRRKDDIEKTLAWPIFQEMTVFIKDDQVIPNENAFYEYVLKPKYKDMTKGQYRYHFGELVRLGFIFIEPKTRAVRVKGLRIIETDDDLGSLSA